MLTLVYQLNSGKRIYKNLFFYLNENPKKQYDMKIYYEKYFFSINFWKNDLNVV